MMRLYFMRHGHAEDGTLDISDAQRAITPEGFVRLNNAATVLQRLNIQPAYILSSPRVRAHQTAKVVADALNMPVTIDEAVNFGFHVGDVRRFMVDYPNKDLMFVGHEPTMTDIIGKLTGANIAMKKGAVARVDMYAADAVRGELVWMITPKVFDALANG